jgi:hypothetical protein
LNFKKATTATASKNRILIDICPPTDNFQPPLALVLVLETVAVAVG